MQETDSSIKHKDITPDSMLELHEYLEQIVRVISEEILICDAVGIFLPQSNGTFRGYVGKPKAINGITLDQVIINPNQDMFYQEIVKNRKYIYIPDTSKDSRPDKRAIEFFNIKSLLALPLYYEEEIFGLVSVFVTGTSMILSEKEIHAVEAYVKMAAIAIRNAKLLSQKQVVLLEKQLLLTATQEESLKAQERFLKVFKFNPVAMSITSKNGYYIDANDSWFELFDIKKEELVDRSIDNLDFVGDGDFKGILYIEHEFTEYINKELTLVNKKGDKRIVLYTTETIELSGEKCILNVFNDVTELKKFEKEITRLDRLNLIAQMAAGMAHEIRNPMSTVKGFLQILRQKNECNKHQNYYDLMISELDRANLIISEFLSIAKNKATEVKKINLLSIVNNILPLLEAEVSVRNNGHLLILELDEVPDLLLDEKEIRQLILNLVINAIEAMPNGGNITIKTYSNFNHIILAIKDEGQGIGHSILERLGTPFVTTKESGTGLGLAVCYSIAARHNMKIDVKTGKEGTTFNIIFNASGNSEL